MMMASSPASGNVAGFGARRLQDAIETQRQERERERARWEQQQYEEQQNELQQYEAQRQAYEEQEYQRAMDEQREYERAQQEQLEYERAQYEQPHQDWSQHDVQQAYDYQHSYQQHDTHHTYDYQHESQHQQWQHDVATSPNGDDFHNYSRSRSSSEGRVEAATLPKSTSYSSVYGGCYDEGPSSEPSTLDVPVVRRPERETFYDDDFEESEHMDMIGKTHLSLNYLNNTDCSARDSSFHVARATVIQPDLPKAKCADCGEKLEFEDLADHACLSRGISGISPLIIQSSPIPNDSATSFGGLLSPASLMTPNTPRSPFFDRYQDILGDSGPLSPAFSAPTTPADFVDDERPWMSKSMDPEETPKAHALRIVGPSAKRPSTNSSLAVSSQDRPLIQRSVSELSGDADARRKMIEEQRALKKKVLSTAAVVAKETLVTKTPSLTQHTDGHHKTASCSSVSSTASSLLDNPMAHRNHAALRGMSTTASDVSNITPSSSYERFDESSPPALSDMKPSHKTRTQSRGRSEIDLSSIEEMMKGLITSPEPMPKQARGRSEPSSPRHSATQVPKRTDRERILEKELERLRERERTRQLQMLRLKEKKRKEREAKRCCVCDCSLTSSRTPFVERDGKLLCARDWKELYLPKCRKCNLAVENGAVKSSDGALRGVFHRACFACAACDAPFLDGSFYVYNSQPYCSRHYHRLNGSLCRECETGIEGDCRQTDTGEKYHPECFRCQWTSRNGPCAQQLSAYHLVSGQRLCQRHAEKVNLKLAIHGGLHSDLSAGMGNTMLHQTAA